MNCREIGLIHLCTFPPANSIHYPSICTHPHPVSVYSLCVIHQWDKTDIRCNASVQGSLYISKTWRMADPLSFSTQVTRSAALFMRVFQSGLLIQTKWANQTHWDSWPASSERFTSILLRGSMVCVCSVRPGSVTLQLPTPLDKSISMNITG